MRGDIKQQAEGRWYDILATLGVEAKYLINKHGPCPVCGGNDRFRWDNKGDDGTFYCSSCGAGDGFNLLMLLKGIDFPAAARLVEGVLGIAKVRRGKPGITDDKKRSDMLRRWRASRPILDGGPVSKYLMSRLGVVPTSKALREAKDGLAMVACMQAPDGVSTMIHLTFLTADGRKAEIEKPRLMMPGTIKEGSAVRLADYTDTLGVGEGLETCMAATILTGIPCWSALNEVILQKWVPPEGVKRVVIFGDSDRNYVGQAAAYGLGRRLSLAKNAPEVEVRIPEQLGTDWNDVLRAKL